MARTGPERQPGGADEEFLVRACSLLHAYARASENGIQALDVGDLEGLEAALSQRAEILPALEPIFAELRSAPPGPVSLADEMERFHSVAEAAESLDIRFRVALGSETQSISRELEALESGDALRTAYGQRPTKEGRNIDLVR